MLSVSVNPLKPPFSSTFLNPLTNHSLHSPLPKTSLKPISAVFSPSSQSKQQPQYQNQNQLYQPFRPPPSNPLTSQFHSLDISNRLDILANRLGLWFEYALLIPALVREGFTPSSLEEATGISGVEQNRLVVAAQVRDSLVQSTSNDPELLYSFDLGGAELLYEIRLLSALSSSVVFEGLPFASLCHF